VQDVVELIVKDGVGFFGPFVTGMVVEFVIFFSLLDIEGRLLQKTKG